MLTSTNSPVSTTSILSTKQMSPPQPQPPPPPPAHTMNGSTSTSSSISTSSNNSSSSSNSSSSGSPNQDWLECAKWLDSLHVLAPRLSACLRTNQHNHSYHSLTLGEFANSLRDGESLCALANTLLPGCIDSALINKQSQKSQILSLNNIRLFLDACKSYMGMREADLFGEHMLYDLLNLGCVLRTLSIISRSELAVRRTGLNGFNVSLPYPTR